MPENVNNQEEIHLYTDQIQSAQKKQLISFSTAFLSAFNLFFFGPTDIYLTNIKDMTVSSCNIVLPAIIISIFIAAIIFILLYNLKGKAHITTVNIIMGLSLALYVQGNFLQTSSAVLDGGKMSLDVLGCIINILIWGVCISVPFLVYRFLNSLYTKAVGFLTLMICVMEIAAMTVSIITTVNLDDTGILYDALMNKSEPYMHSQENEFTFSSDHNLIIVLADEYDSFCFDSTLEEAPASTEALKDFTYYKDTLGMYGFSNSAIDHIFSGKLINDSDYSTDFFDSLASNGYNMGFYITNNDVLPINISEKYADNYKLNKTEFSDIINMTECIYKLVGYKYSPMFAKPIFFMTNAEISKMMSSSKAYYPDNLAFYNMLPDSGSITEKKVFKFFYLYGLHDPRNITKDLQRAPDWSISGEEQAIAVNKIFSAFLEMLKETGAYDNSDIILLADHGIKSHENGRYPLIMIKRAGETHDELNVSSLRVSYEQVFPTLVELAGGDSADKTIFELTPDDNETRYYDFTKEYVSGNLK